MDMSDPSVIRGMRVIGEHERLENLGDFVGIKRKKNKEKKNRERERERNESGCAAMEE